VKKEQMTEERKAGWARKVKPGPHPPNPLAQSLGYWLVGRIVA